MESLKRSGDGRSSTRQGRGGSARGRAPEVATASILAATTTLRDSIERDVNPATQRLARQMGEQLVASLVTGSRGRCRRGLQLVGRNMSLALIKGAAEGADDPVNQAGFGRPHPPGHAPGDAGGPAGQ